MLYRYEKLGRDTGDVKKIQSELLKVKTAMSHQQTDRQKHRTDSMNSNLVHMKTKYTRDYRHECRGKRIKKH